MVKSNTEKLVELAKTLPGKEREIVEKLGGMILNLGHVQVLEGNKTYDLAFKSLEKSRKPSFATFITHTYKESGVWNRNEVPDSVIVQIKFKNINDHDKINNPKNWEFFGKALDFKKGWFNFRVKDVKPDTMSYAFSLIKEAYDSFS